MISNNSSAQKHAVAKRILKILKIEDDPRYWSDGSTVTTEWFLAVAAMIPTRIEENGPQKTKPLRAKQISKHDPDGTLWVVEYD